MNTRQFVKEIQQKTNLEPSKIKGGLALVYDLIGKSLARYEPVKLQSFGTFQTKEYKSRPIAHPTRPGQKLLMFKKNIAKFKISPSFKKELSKADIQTEEDLVPNPLSFPINIQYVSLANVTIEPDVLNLIPESVARRFQAVPIKKEGAVLYVGMIDPEDQEAIEFIKRTTNLEVRPRLIIQQDLEHVLEQYGGEGGGEFEKIVGEFKTPSKKEAETKKATTSIVVEKGPASQIVSKLLLKAIRERASDIHLEPTSKELQVRFRVDGILKIFLTLPKEAHRSTVSRIKVLTNMKLDETRLPQDGRFQAVIDKREVDFRVSTFPTVEGEKVVMRILDKSAGTLALEELGLKGRAFKILEDNISKSHGMTLVTGPTGSGKTTTLYAVLQKIKNPQINIVTLEDPVEYRVDGVNQGQVNTEIDFTFARGLRSIVRQDPNVIMVGEIRDQESASLGIQSALTGHIVLSTLHTNDAAGAIPRLIDMNVEPFLITSSLNAVVAQRLARKICENCKGPYPASTAELEEVKAEIKKLPSLEASEMRGKELHFQKGKGCSVCGDGGYKGRIGIFEILPVTNTIKNLINRKSSSVEIGETAIKEGMITLKQDGVLKALDGLTTLEEVWRVTKD